MLYDIVLKLDIQPLFMHLHGPYLNTKPSDSQHDKPLRSGKEIPELEVSAFQSLIWN